MITRSFSPELQAILNLLPGAYLLLSPQLQVELVSTGYQAAQAAGWPCLQAGEHAPTVLEAASAGQCLARKLQASLAQVLRTGQPHEAACHRRCQLPGQAPAGASSAWRLLSQPVRNVAGAVSHLLCQISLDPATPAQVAQAGWLGAASGQGGGLAAGPGQPSLAFCLLRGPRYVVELCSPLAAQVWGLSAVEALGRPFLELLPPLVVASYATACASVWHSGQAVSWPEMLVAAPAASECVAELTYLNVSFQAFRPQQAEQAGILLIAQNVTPLLQARQQAQQLRAELAATTAGLADYVAELLRASPGNG